jgi:hypothetical protein
LVILFFGFRGLFLLERLKSAEKEFPLVLSGEVVSLSIDNKALAVMNSVPGCDPALVYDNDNGATGEANETCEPVWNNDPVLIDSERWPLLWAGKGCPKLVAPTVLALVDNGEFV